MRLAPGDEGEGEGVAAKAEHRQRGGGLDAAGRRNADQRRARPEQRCGETDAKGHERQRRQFLDRDTDEEERSTPQQGEHGQQSPFARGHRALHRSGHRRISEQLCSVADYHINSADVRPILADKFHGATQGERAITSSLGSERSKSNTWRPTDRAAVGEQPSR